MAASFVAVAAAAAPRRRSCSARTARSSVSSVWMAASTARLWALLDRRHAQHPQQRLAHHAARPGADRRIGHVAVLRVLLDVAQERPPIGVGDRRGFVEDPGGQLLDEGDVGIGSCGHGLTCAEASGVRGSIASKASGPVEGVRTPAVPSGDGIAGARGHAQASAILGR